MKRLPDHRFFQAKEMTTGATRPEDPLTLEMSDYLACTAPLRDTVNYAYDLYKDLEHRMVLDAFLLSRCPYATISTTLEIPVEVLDVYVHLFMDLSVFRNKLEVLTFAKEYPGGPYAKEMVRTAVTVGYDYLIWAYGNPDEDRIDARHIVRKTMIDAFMRGQAHKGNSLTSAVTKEAKAWTAMAVGNASLIEKIDPRTAKAAVNELRIAIEGRDTTVPAAALPVPVEDILH